MDLRTAQDVARIRARTAVAAGVLTGLLTAGCLVLALTVPREVRVVFWGGVVLAALGVLGCTVVLRANRALERDPRALAGVHRLAALLPLSVGAWVAVVLVVGVVSGDLATALLAVPLVMLVVPALVVSSVTRRGPHPGA